MSGQNRSIAVSLLVAAVMALGVLAIGGKSFWASHMESRRALIARTMVETGDYLIPQANGKVTLTKPPLYYWAVAASYGLTGRTDEGSARLPSVLFGWGTLWLVYLIGGRLYNRATGAWSAAALATSYLFAQYMRFAELDVMFTFFISLAFYFLLPLLDDDRPPGVAPHLFWIAVALGFLVKGPFALMFPVAAYLALLPFRADITAALKNFFPLKGVLLFAAITAPWFVYAFLFTDSGATFITETLGRVADDRDKPHSIFFYVPALSNFLPWALPLPFAIYAAFARDAQKNAFVLSWFITGMIVASLIKAKSVHYILPLYPAAALLVGRYIAAAIERAPEESGWIEKSALVFGLVMTFLPTLLFALLPVAPFFTDMIPHIHPGASLLVLAVLGFTSMLAWHDFRADNREELWMKAMGSLLVLFVFTHALAIPMLNTRNSHREFLLDIRPKIAPDVTLIQYKQNNYQVPFYLKRTVPDVQSPEELAAFDEKMGKGMENYLIITNSRDQEEALRTVDGHVIARDEHFVAVSERKEGDRFVLMQAHTDNRPNEEKTQ